MRGAALAFLETVLAYEGVDCLIWPYGTNLQGYAQVKIDQKHSCNSGSKGCVSKAHLDWKTHAENEADKIANGTANRGERCNLAKLTADDVTAIRKLIGTMPQKDIAVLFGTSKPNITAIKKRQIWQHLP